MVFVKTGAGIFFLKFSAQRRIADYMVELSPEQRNLESVFPLENGRVLEIVALKIREDLERVIPGFPWQEFINSAQDRWQEYIPNQALPSERPSAEELASFRWSDLVPESLMDREKTVIAIDRAWNVWDSFLKKHHKLGLYIAVSGTMGTGKSVFSRALEGGRPFESTHFGEAWEDNPELQMFYRLLAIWASSACRQSQRFPKIAAQLAEVQGRAQSWFAARKFLQGLKAMCSLIWENAIQDNPLGQDGVYCETQVELGLSNESNIASYRQDNRLRQRFLPPPIRSPILVFLWAPFETVRKRILEVRGRDYEAQIPKGYLLALHRNTIQWMLAMVQTGVPTIVLDAGMSDFRPGMIDRSPVVQKTWDEIQRIRRGIRNQV